MVQVMTYIIKIIQIMTKKLTTTIPPKSGPMPQGLKLSYNTVKDVKLTEKINGRHRQSTSKHKKRI
jgi:hypothetical protein